MKKLSFLFIIFILIHSSVSAIERRTEQFPTDFGYLALPLPYVIPGAGMGLGLLVALTMFHLEVQKQLLIFLQFSLLVILEEALF